MSENIIKFPVRDGSDPLHPHANDLMAAAANLADDAIASARAILGSNDLDQEARGLLYAAIGLIIADGRSEERAIDEQHQLQALAWRLFDRPRGIEFPPHLINDEGPEAA